jgi:hypothetical protein
MGRWPDIPISAATCGTGWPGTDTINEQELSQRGITVGHVNLRCGVKPIHLDPTEGFATSKAHVCQQCS